MIWGLTTEELDERLKQMESQWHPVFAWRPKVLWDGRKAWLCRLERIGRFSHEVAALKHELGYAVSSHDGLWVYRLAKPMDGSEVQE